MNDAVSLTLELPHPPDKVWRALTDPVLLEQWLLPVLNLNLETGAPFQFKTQAFPGWDGTVSCRFVEIELHRTLKYTWAIPGLDTVVTFTLTPTEAGTRLSILQTGFTSSQKRELGGARYGWNMMAGKLFTLLKGQP
jgi:uncharacterized protein YndB with AHSA1/START domain